MKSTTKNRNNVTATGASDTPEPAVGGRRSPRVSSSPASVKSVGASGQASTASHGAGNDTVCGDAEQVPAGGEEATSVTANRKRLSECDEDKYETPKKLQETLIVTVTNGIRHVTIRSTIPEEKQKVERLPVTVMTTNQYHSIPPKRDMIETDKEETLNFTNSIMNNLNVNNLNTMAQKMIAITIGSKSILEDVMEVIHQKALSKPNLSGEYAEMCAMMAGDHSFTTKLQALDVTVLQVLLPKCYDILYSHRQQNNMPSEDKETTTSHTSSHEKYARLLANAVFIAELYNKGVLPESNLWSFVMDLVRNDNNAQVHCLATILKSAGPRLSKTYSLASIVGHLLILENESEREEVMCSDLRNLIHNLKIQHAKYWIHEEPDRAVKENMRRVNVKLIKPNKSVSVRAEYALNLMAHCTLVDCWDLLSTFKYWKNLNEVKHLLTPALNALMKTDQLDFIVHMVVMAVKETCPRSRADAGKLLAELVKARLLSKLIVYLGFEEVSKNYAKDKNIQVLVSELDSEFVRQL